MEQLRALIDQLDRILIDLRAVRKPDAALLANIRDLETDRARLEAALAPFAGYPYNPSAAPPLTPVVDTVETKCPDCFKETSFRAGAEDAVGKVNLACGCRVLLKRLKR